MTFGGQLSWWTARFASGIAYAVWIALVLTLRYLLYIYTLVEMNFTRHWTLLVMGNFVDTGQGLYVMWRMCGAANTRGSDVFTVTYRMQFLVVNGAVCLKVSFGLSVCDLGSGCLPAA